VHAHIFISRSALFRFDSPELSIAELPLYRYENKIVRRFALYLTLARIKRRTVEAYRSKPSSKTLRGVEIRCTLIDIAEAYTYGPVAHHRPGWR